MVLLLVCATKEAKMNKWPKRQLSCIALAGIFVSSFFLTAAVPKASSPPFEIQNAIPVLSKMQDGRRLGKNKRTQSANTSPLAQNDTVTAIEDNVVSGNLLLNDVDLDSGDVLTISTPPVILPMHGMLQINSNGSFVYVPDLNFNGSDSFSYEVCDNGSPVLCDSALVILQLVAENDAPLAVNDSIQMAQGTAFSGNLISNDYDVDSPTLLANTSVFNGPQNGTVFLANSGVYTYTPNTGFSGTDSFQYVVCDTDFPSKCDTALVFILVGANNAPVATNDVYLLKEDEVLSLVSLLSNDFDPDGAVLQVSTTPIVAPQIGNIQLYSNGTFNYSPPLNYFGLDSFSYLVCDGGNPNLCDTAWVSILIEAVNDAPMATNDTFFIMPSKEVSENLLLNDTDVESQQLSLTTQAILSPFFGSLQLFTNGAFVYTPYATFHDSDSFRYEVCDTGTPALCTTATVKLYRGQMLEELIIPNAFSPNGDNLNDAFEIGGIQNFPENEIQIFDRNGLLVYSKSGYLNTWTGIDRKGKQLANGSYYYILTTNKGTDARVGYVVLSR